MIREHRTPAFRFGSAALFGLIAFAIAIYSASRQSRSDHLFQEGDWIGSSANRLAIEAIDLIREPGQIGDAVTLSRFYERQSQFASLLASKDLQINDRPASLTYFTESLNRLPADFWVQLGVGLGAFIISAWVWALRRGDIAARMFFLSGISTLLFTFAAAVYTSRHLALPITEFKFWVGLNVIGASGFGMATINLFLVYPFKGQKAKRFALTQTASFGIWTLASVCSLIPPWAGVNLITLCEMVGICSAIGFQFRATRGNPVARASLSWLSLSVLLGAGFFIAVNAIPLVLGSEVAVEQSYAFLAFLLVYFGLAAGITRYRLFEVGRWAFRFLFYGVGTIALFLLDGLFVMTIGIERWPAFALSLFTITFAYLPLKVFIQERLNPSATLPLDALLGAVLNVSFVPSYADRSALWRTFLQKLFNPLTIQTGSWEGTQSTLLEDGMSMVIPSVGGIPSLKISYRAGGKRLFDSESVGLANQIISAMRQAESNREAYDRGEREERRRITQDLHDDVGASLLTLLHNAEEGTRTSIQSIISDIRNIVNEMAEDDLTLDDIVADLRHETRLRLQAANIGLTWEIVDQSCVKGRSRELFLGYREHKALRSAVRELVSNVIRHSGASEVTVVTQFGEDFFDVKLSDNGQGISQAREEEEKSVRKGFGLKNLQSKLMGMGGALELQSSDRGTCLDLRIPYGLPIREQPAHSESLRGSLPRDWTPEAFDRLS